ncbi:membrane hypothetical protein [Bradyrhizobium sp. STM 3843]|uniref:hypothetical protein n=1 Tax=Bradyrhizobium sp. STM 3843 TaxID=551947 RepID=UPI000240A3E5|nr:hypothetical protein [Bradyrhizobium sp. STM 3843]CCE04120.1 membrane hypothetical protein [Bradyrhizobium sp. STM 3843]
MTLFRLISIAIPLLDVYGGMFCYFFAPAALTWLFFASLLFVVPLACLSIEALFCRYRKWSTAFALTWLLLVLPFAGVPETREWLRTLGFYARTQLVSDYMSQCRLSEFIESGVTQTAGFCEGFDRGDYFDYVVYDTSGEFILPASRRTSEWKKVMSAATAEATVERDRTAYHLFGNYYAVVASFFDGKG